MIPSLAFSKKPATGKPDFNKSGAQEISVSGKRQLASYEVDSYGPLPYPETVARFVYDEIALILSRQREDGSFEFLAGRRVEAGGTVGLVTQASLCGYSLREHVDLNPKVIEPSIRRTLNYVTHMVRSGKLRNGRDSTWWYAYSLRFLVHEYPHVKDSKTKALVEDACVFLLHELENLQQGTVGQKSEKLDWRMHASPGMFVDDDKLTGLSVVIRCPVGSPAFVAGIREGDILKSANGTQIHTKLRYHIAHMSWLGGDTLDMEILRQGKVRRIKLHLAPQYPGTLGLICKQENHDRVVVAGFETQSGGGAIAVGDRITKIDGKKISSQQDIRRLKLFSGQKLRIELERGGKAASVDLVCMPIPSAKLGAVIQADRDQSTLSGLRIQNLSKDSCLKKAGIKVGHRILRINGAVIMNRRNFFAFENMLYGGEKILVTYVNTKGEWERTVEVIAGKRTYQNSLRGYHGIVLDNRRGAAGAVIKAVAPGSPANTAGCRAGDVINRLNTVGVQGYRDAKLSLDNMLAGQSLQIDVRRKGEEVRIEFAVNRPTKSPWISANIRKGGGWAYYTHVRGGTTFLTSDILRELVHAKKNIPIPIPEALIRRPFEMLSNLRMKQPNSKVESYRYDAGGSFWGVRDIRGDIGRITGAELSCLMYCDTDLKHEARMGRTQEQLAKTLETWIRYRGILDLAKTGGHQKFSIAPWYWPYSYLTTLQAAEYLNCDDALKSRVQKIALKAYFQYTQHKYLKELGKKGWLIGYYPKVELLRVCLLLDGLGSIKHLYRPRVTAEHPALKKALAMFNASRYGEAYVELKSIDVATSAGNDDLKAQIMHIKTAIDDRFTARLKEIKAIHKKFPQDALRYLEMTKPDFKGFPESQEMNRLLVEWKKQPAK